MGTSFSRDESAELDGDHDHSAGELPADNSATTEAPDSSAAPIPSAAPSPSGAASQSSEFAVSSPPALPPPPPPPPPPSPSPLVLSSNTNESATPSSRHSTSSSDEKVAVDAQAMVMEQAPNVYGGYAIQQPHDDFSHLLRAPYRVTPALHRITSPQCPHHCDCVIRVELHRDSIVFGNEYSPNVQVYLTGGQVAPLHARLVRVGPADWSVQDLGSAFGTFVNDVRLPSGTSCLLKPYDRVRLGADSTQQLDPLTGEMRFTPLPYNVKPEFSFEPGFPVRQQSSFPMATAPTGGVVPGAQHRLVNRPNYPQSSTSGEAIPPAPQPSQSTIGTNVSAPSASTHSASCSPAATAFSSSSSSSSSSSTFPLSPPPPPQQQSAGTPSTPSTGKSSHLCLPPPPPPPPPPLVSPLPSSALAVSSSSLYSATTEWERAARKLLSECKDPVVRRDVQNCVDRVLKRSRSSAAPAKKMSLSDIPADIVSLIFDLVNVIELAPMQRVSTFVKRCIRQAIRKPRTVIIPGWFVPGASRAYNPDDDSAVPVPMVPSRSECARRLRRLSQFCPRIIDFGCPVIENAPKFPLYDGCDHWSQISILSHFSQHEVRSVQVHEADLTALCFTWDPRSICTPLIRYRALKTVWIMCPAPLIDSGETLQIFDLGIFSVMPSLQRATVSRCAVHSQQMEGFSKLKRLKKFALYGFVFASPDDDALNVLKKIPASVKTLSLDYDAEFTEGGSFLLESVYATPLIQSAFERFVNVTSFTMGGLTKNAVVQEVMMKPMTKLSEYLSQDSNDASFLYTPDFSSLPNLTNMRIQLFGASELALIARKCPNLKALDIATCSSLPQIISLAPEDGSLPSEFPVFSKLVRLGVLDVSMSAGTFLKFPNLTELRYALGRDDSEPDVPSLRFLETCEKLRYLTLAFDFERVPQWENVPVDLAVLRLECGPDEPVGNPFRAIDKLLRLPRNARRAQLPAPLVESAEEKSAFSSASSPSERSHSLGGGAFSAAIGSRDVTMEDVDADANGGAGGDVGNVEHFMIVAPDFAWVDGAMYCEAERVHALRHVFLQHMFSSDA